MKKFIQEFKEFAFKGSVVDMAVGIIIGGAFTSLVTAFVDDIISPLLGLFGSMNLDAMKVVLKGTGDTAVTLNYGAFLAAVINFLLMALVLFVILRSVNRTRAELDKLAGVEKKKEEAPKKSDELIALEQIRDLLAEEKKEKAA
jgi:large conductance mechanosensitive channel